MVSPPLATGNSVERVTRALASLLTPLLVSLFFLGALRLYFSQVYLLVWAALFSEPIDLKGLATAGLALLALLVPLLLPLLRRRFGPRQIALSGAIGVSLARILLSAGLPFGLEVLASSATIGLYGLFLPAYFEEYHPARTPRSSRGYLVAGLTLALAYDMAVRALGTTVDLTLQPAWLGGQVVLSAIAIACAYLSRRTTDVKPGRTNLTPLSPWTGVMLLTALGPLLFLEFNLFMHASTVSRWILVDYDLMSVLIPAATVIGLLVPRFKGLQSLPAAAVKAAFILLAVLAFLWWDGWLSASLILIGQMCLMLQLRLLFHLAASHSYRWKSSTVVGVGFSLSLLIAFLLTFALTLSFAYAYTLDFFRGTEPLTYLAAGLATAVALLLATSRIWLADIAPPEVPWVKQSVAALPVALALVGVALQPIVNPQPAVGRSLSVMTYNLHQCFGMDNKLDLGEVAFTIRQANPDVIGLQEADGGRVPSMSVDEVLWLSRELNMYSAYGPSWGSSYGVAILSKHPITERKVYLLASQEQQRSLLETSIDVGSQTLTFFSVHLGLNAGERERQLDEVLAYTIEAGAPKVIVGDFNAHPDSHEIGRVLQQFASAFESAGSGNAYTSPADAPVETIDYIFVSPDIEVVSGEVLTSLGSDHLPVVARLQLPTP
jgi:endonuclease/exonuclease/phosphatase family metal-dependent hydrolase